MPQRIAKIEEIKPGTKAVKDVADARGNLLAKAGSELTAVLLERLKGRGITHVVVEEAGAGLSPEQIEAKKKELDAVLEKQFEAVKGQPLMAALLAATKAHHFSRIS